MRFHPRVFFLLFVVIVGTARNGVAAETYPALGTHSAITSDISLHENRLRHEGLVTKVWIYLPTSALSKKVKLPCVLIAPAGTRLWHGMNLASGDRAEHLPYVRAGFAVVSYTVSGFLSGEPIEKNAVPAMRLYKKSQAGLLNARAALNFALTRVSQIDAKRIYTVGHSSAATTALWVAASEPRVAACVAFAPATDVPSHLRGDLNLLEEWLPGISAFLQATSPRFNVKRLTKPVFLFHADNDTNVPIKEIESFYKVLKINNPAVTLERVPRGGHYSSMIRDGIPKAIKWLQGL